VPRGADAKQYSRAIACFDADGGGRWALGEEARPKTRPMIGALDLYYRLLTPVCSKSDIWQTTYVHPLDGPDAIVD
jgi:trans-aconitate 2-methyltransferase